ncbi:response regulator [Almyronema epifaneia]|uniref:Response regulator n=1 Tax=Almyronema epifaneia S1 TaxID=2991925 RepID=A0ABW6IGR1_9CYAN
MYDQSSLLHGLSLLAVDTNRDLLSSLTEVFQVFGCTQVMSATTIEEAVHLIAIAPPNIIISEIRLAHQNGFDLLGQVKKVEAERQIRIPVVAVTAYVTRGGRDCALAAGFSEYMTKPFSLKELIMVVARLTDRA